MEFSRKRTIVITIGIMSGLFMASMESTVVATAMPTIIAQLGGLEIYSWAFSAYMLASTTTVPIYGKLADLYGRRTIYAVAMIMFLAGSMLSGQARSMEQLIIFRTLQGFGAGGLMPLAFTMIGDMFSFEQRAKMQGVFSSIWGVSSVVGPLLGGFLVDQISWRWVFYVNVLPGLVAGVVIWLAWRDTGLVAGEKRVRIDYVGAALLFAGVVLLLLGLFALGTAQGWAMLAVAMLMLAALIWVEQRVEDPILPLPLFRNRLFTTACLHGLLSGGAMFGSISFIPLFVQVERGASATAAGAMLTPVIIGWVTASTIGGRLLLKIGYRTLVLVGVVLLTIGAFMMTRVDATTSQVALISYLAMMGLGMGASVPAFLIAVQSAVRRRQMGTATATIQFSRNMGGAIGVSVMGVVLALTLAANLTAVGIDPDSVDTNALLDSESAAEVEISAEAEAALSDAIRSVFVVALVGAAAALAVSTLAPRGSIAQMEADRLADEAAASQMIAGEAIPSEPAVPTEQVASPGAD
ncbi:MAG: MFS transporter [Ardenticatenales bacterium]|nr:MFS transporter [Ardenticatenales bacterium]